MRRSWKLSAASAALAVVVGAMAWADWQPLREKLLAATSGLPLYDRGEWRVRLLRFPLLDAPTALQWGPDDRLYIANQYGWIWRCRVRRSSEGLYHVVEYEGIDAIWAMPNHDDWGRPAPDLQERLITGLLVRGSAESPELIVASSDPRLIDPEIDTRSGVISKLEKVDGGWRRTDLLSGLPRSRYDHAANALAVRDGKLYVGVGSMTGSGAPSAEFFGMPEVALSSAVLEVDLDRLPYDLPAHGEGRGSVRQAVLEPDAPLRLFATGLRNPYRLVPDGDGFYTVDNGPNTVFGGPPIWRDGHPTNEPNDFGEFGHNPLLRIERGGYYGHPNPTRAWRGNLFDGRSSVAEERPEEGYFIPAGKKPGELLSFRKSTNGIDRYADKLAIASFDRTLRLVAPDPAGGTAVETPIVRQLGAMPLDLEVSGTDSSFPNVIWVADYSGAAVYVVEPVHEPSAWDRVAAAGQWVLVKVVEQVQGRLH